jgi:hypothetical protein
LLIFSISAFTIGDNTTALHHFAIILDPLSEQAQKYTSLFEVFTNLTILDARRKLNQYKVAFTHTNCHRGISLATAGVHRGARASSEIHALLRSCALAAFKTVLPL